MHTTIMWLHIITGTIAIVAGTLALLSRKGRPLHIRSGRVFVISMLPMAISGAVIAAFMPMHITVIAGLLTFHFVATSWLTVSSTSSVFSWYNKVAPAVALGLSVYAGTCATLAIQSGSGTFNGFSAVPYCFFGMFALFAGVMDSLYLKRNGFKGKHRIVRHLWRMCMALFVALGSFFSQGSAVLPVEWQGSEWLSVPEFAVLLIMIGYIARTLLAKR